MKIKYNMIRKLIMAMLIFTPIIDIINGIGSKYIGISLPFGQIIRGIILILSFSVIMIMPHNEFKWKFISTISLLYYVIHIGIIYIINNSPLNYDISMSMKVCIYIYIYCFINCCINQKIIYRDDIYKVIKYSIKIVPVSILISSILGISFTSYGDSNVGIRGLFIATNSINIVLIILLIFSFHFYYSNNRGIIDILLNLIALVMIGSKSSFIFIVFIITCIVLFNSKNRIKTIISISIILLIIIIVSMTIFKNELLLILSRQEYFYSNAINDNKILDYLLSGRNRFLRVAHINLINKISLGKLIYGIGLYNMQYQIGNALNYGILKGIEMDFFDIFYSYGILGVLTSYGLFLYGFKYKIKDKKDKLFINLALISIFIFSFLGGHTFTEAMPATYVAIILSLKYCINREEKDEEYCNNCSL